MNIVNVILVLVALFVGWYLGNRNRRKLDEELRDVRGALGLAGERVGSLENQLQLTSGDYEKRLSVVYGVLDKVALDIDQVLSEFPYIEEINQLLARMSKEDFKGECG